MTLRLNSLLSSMRVCRLFTHRYVINAPEENRYLCSNSRSQDSGWKTNVMLKPTTVVLSSFAQVPVRPYSTNTSISDKIENMIKNNKLVVFMKGVPENPMCGFSNAVVQVLRMHGIENYDAHNVLEDDDLRQGIKDFSNWPTIPQVYLNGEFIGGCDIMLQMHQNGELIEELKKIGIESALSKE